MERAAIRTRDIQFYSEKNQRMICVHSRPARDFARWLEQQPWVKTYQTCVPLEQSRFPNVSPIDIRKEYFSQEWTTDFLIQTADGRRSVREFIDERELTKKAVVEKMELSRRYWAVLDVADWKLVTSGKTSKKRKEDQML